MVDKTNIFHHQPDGSENGFCHPKTKSSSETHITYILTKFYFTVSFTVHHKTATIKVTKQQSEFAPHFPYLNVMHKNNF